jgi:hypothetical protein
VAEADADPKSPERSRNQSATPRSSTNPLLRFWKWILAAVVAGLAITVGGLVQSGVLLAEHHVLHAIQPDSSPIDVAVITDPVEIPEYSQRIDGPNFVIPKRVQDLGAPPVSAPNGAGDPAWYAWAHKQGGVDALESLVRLVVRGHDASQTTINSVTVSLRRRAPVATGLLVGPSGQGGGITPRGVDVDLGQQTPAVTWWDGANRVAPMSLVVSSSDTEVLDIRGDATKAELDFWVIQLHWANGTQSGVLNVDDHGRPFETTYPGHDDVGWNHPYWSGVVGGQSVHIQATS